MKKIESARIIEKRNGNCEGIRCFGCFNEKWCDNKKSYRAEVYQLDKLKLAQAYIKRHEGKSKKRIIPTKYTADIQPDKTNAECKRVVTLPKEKPEIKSTIQCYKCISVQTCKRKEKELSILPACDGYISNESMNYNHTVDPNEKKVESVLTTTPSNGITTIDMSNPTPLDIAKAIRDNGYRCDLVKMEGEILGCPACPFWPGECGSGVPTEKQDQRDRRKQLIDDYIAKNDHIEDKLEMVDPQPTEPKPISFDVPDVVYVPRIDRVDFIKTKGLNMAINDGKLTTVCGHECYLKPEEALAVVGKRGQK